MPSPFPGMDPYPEDAALWPEFHRRLVLLHDPLGAALGDRYQTTVGQRRYAAEQALRLKTAAEVRAYLTRRTREVWPDGSLAET